MGRRRQGNRPRKKKAAEVRPPFHEAVAQAIARNADALKANIAATNVIFEALKRRYEPPPMKLTNSQLNDLLAAIQDGTVEYGKEDCEIIGELICEVLEWRAGKIKGHTEPVPAPRPGIGTPLKPIPYPPEARDEEARRMREFMEEMERRRRQWKPDDIGEILYGLPDKPIKTKPFKPYGPDTWNTIPTVSKKGQWRNEINRDEWTLYAPDGKPLWTVSGLDVTQMGAHRWDCLRRDVEKREIERWEDEQK